jgi:hypothetical protein
MTVLASEFVKRKKEHVFVEGDLLEVASDLTGGVAATEETVHVYGSDDPISDITVDNGTLSITVYDKATNNLLLEALQRIDHDLVSATTHYQYKWDNVYETTVWVNRLNLANNQYTRSAIFKNWLPVPGLSAGDASAKGTRTFAGNCAIPREYDDPIIGEKVLLTTGASGTDWTATLAKATPQAVPNVSTTPGTTQTTYYAVRVVAVNEERNTDNTIKNFDMEELTIDTDMVTSAGAVAIDGSTGGDLDKLTWATHVYVNYLYDDGLGVYPDIKPHSLFERIT